MIGTERGGDSIIQPLAWGYAACTALGTALALRPNEPAAPFGIRTGRSAAFDAAIGFGTGMSAPWPMIVVLLTAVRRGDQRSKWLVRALSVMFLIGAAGEPSTWRWKGRPAPDKAVVSGNIALPVLMLTTGP